MAKLALGTVQLGMPYGIANVHGKPEQQAAKQILEIVQSHHVAMVDTSPVYGDSEEIVGQFIETMVQPFQVMTKLPSLQGLGNLTKAELALHVATLLVESRARLKVDQIDYYLIHDERDFVTYGDALLDVLSDLKDQGVITHLGLSLYSPEVAIEALRRKAVDAIQVPINIFDHRFEQSGVLRLARSQGVKVFARSIFLQGLFFLEPEAVGAWLPHGKPPLERLQALVKAWGLSIEALAICFVRDHPDIDTLIIGMETLEQAARNVMLFEHPALAEELRAALCHAFADVHPLVVNPSLWKLPS
ncbi:putative oxidoreductase [compost metagenome]